MNAVLTAAAPLPLPAPDSHWREWVTYGLRWAAARPPIADSARDAVVDGGRFMTVHAYREAEPGPRWRALYDATWPAYRSWYTREGLAARPSLRECRHALTRYLPELVPTWERLCRLSRDDSGRRPDAVDVASSRVRRRLLPSSAAGRKAGSGAQLRLRPGALRSRDRVH